MSRKRRTSRHRIAVKANASESFSAFLSLYLLISPAKLYSHLSEKARIYEFGIYEFLIGVNDLSGDCLLAIIKDGRVDSLL